MLGLRRKKAPASGETAQDGGLAVPPIAYGAAGPIAPPEAVDVQASLFGANHRTADTARDYRKMAWFLSFVAFGLLIGNVMLASALSDAVPLRHAVPYFLQVASNSPTGEAIVDVAPIHASANRRLVIAKIDAMEYVRIRHEMVPDLNEMNRRWGAKCLQNALRADEKLCAFVKERSSPEVYAAFVKQNKDPAIMKMIQDGINRQVRIDVEPIDKGNHQLEVRFTMIDSTNNPNGNIDVIRKRRYVATIWYRFAAQEVPRGQEFLNPTGFEVVRYNLAAAQD